MSFLEIIGSIVAVILSLGSLAAGLGYAYSQYKKGSNDAIRQNNEDLIQRVVLLEKELGESKKKIAELDGKVSTLTSQRNDLQGLVVTALQAFFEQNPDQTKDLGKKLYKSKSGCII